MAKELRQSLEKLRAAADITRALAVQMDELLKLREAVQKAEEATARRRPKQRHREIIISPACRARADAPGIEARAKPRLATEHGNQVFQIRSSVLQCNFTVASSRDAHSKKAQGKKALPGRLFMQSQWRS
jgi:hypothetical protein